jgi:hypothetical protein
MKINGYGLYGLFLEHRHLLSHYIVVYGLPGLLFYIGLVAGLLA